MTEVGAATGVATLAGQRAAYASGAFLRVVNWHNTPRSEAGQLRAELADYLRRYVPVVPEDLDRLYDTGHWHLPRPGILLAFYDGYRANAEVAAEVCDELGITAWFLPPTGFVSCPPAEQVDFARKHDIVLVEEDVASGPRVAMTWDDLERIGRRHVVGAHTATHAQARHVRTADEVEREVLEPVRRIREVTGRTPPAAAWLWGTPFEPGSVAGQALLDAGIRYAFSNTGIERIADT